MWPRLGLPGFADGFAASFVSEETPSCESLEAILGKNKTIDNGIPSSQFKMLPIKFYHPKE